jgi:hypothetical protein
MFTGRLAEACPAVATTVKLTGPEAVGVPDTTPVDEDIASQAGAPCKDQEIPVAPVAEN